jgi:hypothetical protein
VVKMNSLHRFAIVVVVVVTAGIFYGGTAMAAPPSNDTETTAIVVDGVPFTHSTDTTQATPGGPRFCSNSASVFYRFTATEDERLQVDLLGSDYDPTLGVYTRDESGVQAIACNDDRIGLASGIRFRTTAGATYYFIVGQCCGNGQTGGGALTFSVTRPSSEPLEVTTQLMNTGTVDRETGMATISLTVTCNQRISVSADGNLRQLRQDPFLARAYWSAWSTCTPGDPVVVSADVDTETGIVFGPGPATVRWMNVYAYTGWRNGDYYDSSDEAVTVTLV